MKTLLLCALAATAFTTVGCATPETSTEPTERVEREFTTGSNIPRKTKSPSAEGVQVYDREAMERLRDQLPQSPGPAGGPGGGR
jgi:hypothetical protein